MKARQAGEVLKAVYDSASRIQELETIVGEYRKASVSLDEHFRILAELREENSRLKGTIDRLHKPD